MLPRKGVKINTVQARKIDNANYVKKLFYICWIAYFSTYLGRLNYSAALTVIISSGNLTKVQGGMIGTGFFLAYGIGQLFGGFLGDKLSPKWLVFSGLIASSMANLLMFLTKIPTVMLIVWTMNGIAQSFIWSPMLRLLCEYMEEKDRLKYCLSINTTVPFGNITAYGMTAFIIYFMHWKDVFFAASMILFLVALLWLQEIGKVEAYASTCGVMASESKLQEEKGSGSKDFLRPLIRDGLLLILLALIIQGALKDGVTTWIPTYMNETYQLGSVMSIISTMIIPVFNLIGIYFAKMMNGRFFQNEIRTAGFFFCGCAMILFLLYVTSGKSMIVALGLLTLATTSMMAVNTMLVSILPSQFGTIGKASTVSGILNSSVYIGSAASTYGIGTLSSIWGWKTTILGWFCLACIAMLSCILIWRKWHRYQEEYLK